MDGIKEGEVKEVTEMAVLTETISQLTAAVRTLDAIVMVLLHNTDITIPEWKTVQDAEKATSEKIHKCVEMVKVLYGPSETDKS